jgi:hypothetical protein
MTKTIKKPRKKYFRPSEAYNDILRKASREGGVSYRELVPWCPSTVSYYMGIAVRRGAVFKAKSTDASGHVRFFTDASAALAYTTPPKKSELASMKFDMDITESGAKRYIIHTPPPRFTTYEVKGIHGGL